MACALHVCCRLTWLGISDLYRKASRADKPVCFTRFRWQTNQTKFHFRILPVFHMWIVAFLHLVALTLNIFIFLPFLAEGVLEFFFIWSDYKHLQAVSLTLNNPIAQSKKGRIQWRSSLKTVSSLRQLDSWEAKPWNVQHRGKILLELQILFCRIRSTVMICIFFSPLDC